MRPVFSNYGFINMFFAVYLNGSDPVRFPVTSGFRWVDWFQVFLVACQDIRGIKKPVLQRLIERKREFIAQVSWHRFGWYQQITSLCSIPYQCGSTMGHVIKVSLSAMAGPGLERSWSEKQAAIISVWPSDYFLSFSGITGLRQDLND